jgi:hypothetical protein
MCSAKRFEEMIKARKGETIANLIFKKPTNWSITSCSQWNCYGSHSWRKQIFWLNHCFWQRHHASEFWYPAGDRWTLLARNQGFLEVGEKAVGRLGSSPRGSKIAERIYAAKKMYAKKGVPFAEECPAHKKAFRPSTHGTVLGIKFYFKKMKWLLLEEKIVSILSVIDKFFLQKNLLLEEIKKSFHSWLEVRDKIWFKKNEIVAARRENSQLLVHNWQIFAAKNLLPGRNPKGFHSWHRVRDKIWFQKINGCS